jgi:hypothetical protein
MLQDKVRLIKSDRIPHGHLVNLRVDQQCRAEEQVHKQLSGIRLKCTLVTASSPGVLQTRGTAAFPWLPELCILLLFCVFLTDDQHHGRARPARVCR